MFNKGKEGGASVHRGHAWNCVSDPTSFQFRPWKHAVAEERRVEFDCAGKGSCPLFSRVRRLDTAAAVQALMERGSGFT